MEDGMIIGYYILYHLHGFFESLLFNLPIGGGNKELLGMGSQVVNEYV